MKERNATKKPDKYKDKLRKLKAIYKQVPAFSSCDDGCGRCCGPMALHPFEYRHITNYIKKNNLDIHIPNALEISVLLDALKKGGNEVRARLRHCDAMDPETKRCRIYPVRALICRLFGSVPENPWTGHVSLLCPEHPPDTVLDPAVAVDLNRQVAALEHW